MANIDGSLNNADWTKKTWDLPLSVDYYKMVHGPDLESYVKHLMTLPVWKSVPNSLEYDFKTLFPELFEGMEKVSTTSAYEVIRQSRKSINDDIIADDMNRQNVVVKIAPTTLNVLTKTLSMLEQKADRGGIPPKGAQDAAERGLKLRREFGRGGTMVGVARARDISNGVNLSESTVRRMKAYFDRHEVDKQGKDWDNAERPSNGKIAWLLWGGDAGRTWATRLVERWNREDGRTKSIPRWLPNGEQITELEQLAAVLNVDVKTAAWCVIDSKDAPHDLLEKAQRFVRTQAGAIHFGQPIGTPIRKDRESWRGMIYEVVKQTDGITLNFSTGTRPQYGYVVAEQGNNLEIPEGEFFDKTTGVPKMMEWVRKHQRDLDKDNAHLGIWHDKENKEVVFDVSFVIENYDEAYSFGDNNNQQAMWDIVNAEPIYIGGTGDRAALEQVDGKDYFGKANEEVFGHDGRRTASVVRERSGSGSAVKKDDPSAETRNDEDDPSLEDGDWTGRTGTRHYSNGRVIKDKAEEKRKVRDASFWGAPVGTPLPLPKKDKLKSSPELRASLGIGTHGVARAAMASMEYRKRKGLDTETRVDFRKVVADRERAGRIADAYDELPVDDVKAHEAYDQLAAELDEQFDYLTKELGVDIEFVDGDPYESSFEMMDDIENNNRLKVFRTSSTEPHPYLSNEQNDKFRAVHDYFGHAATGRGFAQDGEEAAWVSHSLMFSEKARSALTTETRGQNSWYNTRKQGFAKQKVALLPKEFWEVPNTWKLEDEVKDVYAGTRGEGVSGGVAVPFEIMKAPVRRQSRDRIRRMLDNWNKNQQRKENNDE